jgi:hypothetical protein
LREFNRTTGTFFEEETTKLINLKPQPFKKLHSLTSKEYAYPELNLEFGITIGDLTEEGVEDWVERKDSRRVMLGLDPLTTKETDFHNLPPDPDEEVKSITKSSQGPIVLGIETVTTGAFAINGAEIVMFWGSLELQLEHDGSTFEVHLAFNTPPLRLKISPTSIKDPMEDISSNESLIQIQRDEEDREWDKILREMTLKSNLQFSPFDTPPRFVGEENETKILLPSEENSDLFSNGDGNISSLPFTTRRSPLGNITL